MARGYVEFGMLGFKELDKALSELPAAMSRQVLLRALRKAAEPVLRQAILNAPVGPTGNYVKSIDVRTMRRKRFGVEVAIGPNAPHAHLIEFGTKPRVTEVVNKGKLSDGTTVYGVRVENGAMKPNRYMTRAWEAKKNISLQELREAVWAELSAAAKRLAGKADRGTLSSRDKEAF